MNAKEKRKLETELMQMGLAGLSADGRPSGELLEQLAAMVNRWTGYENRHGEWIDRHLYFRDLLNECDADKRTEMYEALAPRLTFKPLSLAQYEGLIAQKAGNLVSQRRARAGARPKPVEVGGGLYVAAPAELATHAVATLSCCHCDRIERFVADTPVGAMIEARRGGWMRDQAFNKEVCPTCTARAQTDSCGGHGVVEAFRQAQTGAGALKS